MRSDASGCIRMRSDTLGKFSENLVKQIVFDNFWQVVEELCRNGRHQQVPRKFPLWIHLFGALYDPWSSSWHVVPSWDDLREPDGSKVHLGVYPEALSLGGRGR